jgi:sec-independent protein translocase protein TatB
MFDIGFWEVILIFGVGLMILGPERMPRMAAQIGRWIGRARRTANELRRQLQRELDFEEFKKRAPTNPPKPPESQPKSNDLAPRVVEESESVPSDITQNSEADNLKDQAAGGIDQTSGENTILSPHGDTNAPDAKGQEEQTKHP